MIIVYKHSQSEMHAGEKLFLRTVVAQGESGVNHINSDFK